MASSVCPRPSRPVHLTVTPAQQHVEINGDRPHSVEPGRRPSRLPFLTELLRSRGRRRDSHTVQHPDMQQLKSTDNPFRYPSLVSPAADRTGSLPRQYLISGDLMKTSRSRSDNSFHGQPRSRLFRLTENALEYSHHFLNQVKVQKSFPLTSVQGIELVPGNPKAFYVYFKSFVMELEAPSQEEASKWVEIMTQAWSQWQDDAESESPKGIAEDDEEEGSTPQRPQSMQMSPTPSELDDITPTSRHYSLEERHQRKSASPAPRPDNYRPPLRPPRSPSDDSQPPSLDTRDTPPSSPQLQRKSISHSPPPSPSHSHSSPSPPPRPTLETRKTPPPVRRDSRDVTPPPAPSFKGSSSPPKPTVNGHSSSPKGKPSPFRRKMAIRPSNLHLDEFGRVRASSLGNQLRRTNTEDEDWTATYGHRKRERRSLRRRLRLAPKLQKQSAVATRTPEEEEHYKLLHRDYALIKYPRHHWWSIPSEKIFKLDKDNLQLMWRKNDASRFRLRSTLSVDSILEVRLGQNTDRFTKFPYVEVDEQSFSLLYESVKGKYARLESLDLINDHPNHHKDWINGLDSLHIGPVTSMFPTRYENTDPTLLWLKKFWTTCSQESELQEKESLQVFQKLHPTVSRQISRAVLQAAYNHQREATFNRGLTLKWDGFVLYYHLLCGEIGPLHEVFRSYCRTHGRLGLTLDEFREFLLIECHWPESECETARLRELMRFHDHHHGAFKKYVSENKPKLWKQTAHLLSYAGFLSFLRSKHNAAVNPIHNNVYQDMSQPLSHYWINSSHNTYLEADQIKGRSSLDAYVRALLHGSRCIEIDVWDNPLGKEPQIYHGYTLTSKLQLRDVVQTIKEYAFRMSHYPLIISIENHCSEVQQAKMVSIFKEEFRDELGQSMLATENIMDIFGKDESDYRLPSPLQLQGKIILKASYKQEAKLRARNSRPVLSTMFRSSSDTSSVTSSPAHAAAATAASPAHREDSDYNGQSQNGSMSARAQTFSSSDDTDFPSVFTSSGSGNRLRDSKRLRRGATRREAQRHIKAIQAGGSKVELEEDDQELTYTETGKSLRELIIYCRSTSIKPWSWVKQKKTSVCQMFSFSELSAEKVIRSTPEMLACAERQLVRVYPKGARFDSSNYNPVPLWNLGIHMVALNYQYPDLYMHLNQGRFRQNGGCGYVLKPEVMRRPNPGDSDSHIYPFDPNMTAPHYDVPVCNLEIELLSGQNLAPFGKKCTNITVQIATYGIGEDMIEMFPRAMTDEGFWPQWQAGKHKLIHSILMPSLCLVYFKVEITAQRLGSSQLFGQNCITLSSLQRGIKFIQLRKSSGELIPESGLFVRIVKETTLASPSQLNTINSFFSGVALQSFASQTSPLSPSYETKRFYDMQREFSPSSASDDEEVITAVVRNGSSSRQDNGVVLETVVECNGEQEDHL